jgi:cell division protein FtsL
MTTTETNTPATTTLPTTATAVISHWVTLVKAHEKLLLALIAAVVLFHFGNKAYDVYGKYLTTKQTQTNQQIATQETINAALQKQVDTLTATVAAQAKIDDAKIAAAKSSLAAAKKKDDTLALPDLTAHWAELIAAPLIDFQPINTDTVSVNADAAHKTVDQLEQIPALNTQLNATQDKLNGCTSVLTVDSQLITGLETSVSLEKAGRVEDAKVAAVNQKKAWKRGFKWGFGIGIAAAVAVKSVLHI